MDFKDLLQVARRRWKTIVAFFAVGTLGAVAYCVLATPVYHSTARVFISTDTSNASDAYLASAFSSLRVQSYADLADSHELMQRVIKRLNLNATPSELAAKISANVESTTTIIDLAAVDKDPRIAQQITQAEAEELAAYLSELETPSSAAGAAKATSPVKATIVDPAAFDGKPVSPRTALYILVAAILGLLVGAAVAVVRDLLDVTVKSPEDIQKSVNVPAMAHVVYDPAMGEQPLLTDAPSTGARSEAFRVLRTNLQFLDLDEEAKSFVISSAVPGEGKTSTAVNLAIALAQAGRRVLLVDADLRKPQIAKLLGLEGSVGLTTVLVGRSDLTASIQRHHESGIHVLTSGPLPPNPTEVLQSRVARDMLQSLRDAYDAVVIDAPPLLPVADAAIMTTQVDGAILVVRHGKTGRDQLRLAGARVEQVGGRLFGVVVNMTPRRGGATYGYGYGYGYGYPDIAAGRLDAG